MSFRKITDLNKEYFPNKRYTLKKQIILDGEFASENTQVVIDILNNDYNSFIASNEDSDISINALFNGIEEREIDSSLTAIIKPIIETSSIDSFIGNDIILTVELSQSNTQTETFIGDRDIALVNISEKQQNIETFIGKDNSISIYV
jgi:hypothetical protein